MGMNRKGSPSAMTARQLTASQKLMLRLMLVMRINPRLVMTKPKATSQRGSNFGASAPETGNRIISDAVGQVEGENYHANIQEKDPAPGVVVDDPAADGGTDGRRGYHRDTVNGKGHGALLRPEGVGEDGLFAGLESSACRPLQHA